MGKLLNSIPSIRDVDISGHDLLNRFETRIEDDIPPIDEGSGYFPNVQLLQVRFVVEIPRRVQEDIGHTVDDGCETFGVILRYVYSAPVTVVFALNRTIASPSDAVVAVRKFLERECELRDKDYIRFESVGPSPFHANFSLKAGADEGMIGRDFEAQVNRQTGYDLVEFLYNPTVFDEAWKAQEALFVIVALELDLFYLIQMYGNHRMHDWGELMSKVRQLVGDAELPWRVKIWKSLRKGRLLQSTVVQALQFESTVLQQDEDVRDLASESVPDGADTHLAVYIKEAMETCRRYPVRNVLDLLAFFERHRHSQRQASSTILASILGGIIGALFVVALGYVASAPGTTTAPTPNAAAVKADGRPPAQPSK